MGKAHTPTPPHRDVRYIFRPWRREPSTGEKLWAKDYGLKAWPIPVSDAEERGKP